MKRTMISLLACVLGFWMSLWAQDQAPFPAPPEKLTHRATLVQENESGEHMIIKGVVFHSDGKTRYGGLVLYLYQTDASGLILSYAFPNCATKSSTPSADLPQDKAFELRRTAMVRDQIEDRGIADTAVLGAMRRVPRHLFVPPELQDLSYTDQPLPIGLDQTISQPYIVALMTELLELQKDQKVLEIGTGSGYQAAVLAEIADSVWTVEILEPLATSARQRLQSLGFAKVNVRCGDGYAGWIAHAPFDRIIVTAAAEEIPLPLLEQLKEGGKMVIPVGAAFSIQNLILVEKRHGRITRQNVTAVRFVPLVREKPIR